MRAMEGEAILRTNRCMANRGAEDAEGAEGIRPATTRAALTYSLSPQVASCRRWHAAMGAGRCCCEWGCRQGTS